MSSIEVWEFGSQLFSRSSDSRFFSFSSVSFFFFMFSVPFFTEDVDLFVALVFPVLKLPIWVV